MRQILSILWKTERGVIVTVLLILTGTFLLVWGLTSQRGSQMRRHTVPADNMENFLDQTQEERVLRLASHFRCTCGDCEDMPLEECPCAFAVEERNFIREEIIRHTTHDLIVRLVNQRFGGLEAEFDRLVQQ